MPDQVELKVVVQTDGGEKLDNLAKGVQTVEKAAGSADSALKAAEEGIKKTGETAESQSEKIKRFGESIRQHIETPIGSASLSLGKLAEAMGPVGVAGAEVAATLATIGTVAFESMHKLGQLGTEINNISIRTGLSTREVGLFGFAAKAAGGDISSFETGMRMLSRALSDNSEDGKKAKDALSAVGITARDLYGDARQTSDIFLQMSEAMEKMTNTADRNAFAMAVLGRQGLELVPTLLHLKENLDLAQKAGVETFGRAQVKEMEEYHHNVLLIEDTWSKIVHNIEEAAAASAAFFLRGSQSPGVTREQLLAIPGAMPINSGPEITFSGSLVPGTPPGMSAEDFRIAQLRTNRDIASAVILPDTPQERLKKAQENLDKVADSMIKLRDTGKIVDSAGREKTASTQEAQELAQRYRDVANEVTRAQAGVEAWKESQEAVRRAAEATKNVIKLINDESLQGLTGGDRLAAERKNRLEGFRSLGVKPELLDQLAGRDVEDVQQERAKQAQEFSDRIAKIRSQMELQSSTAQIRHTGRLAALQPDSDEDRNRIAYQERIAIAGKLADFNAQQADAQFAREDAAAQTKQQHDEAAQHRMEAYWKSAFEFEKEYTDASNERDERDAEADKRRKARVDVLNASLRAIDRDDQTAQLLRGFEHASKIADLTSGPGGEGTAISAAYEARTAAADLILQKAKETAEADYQDAAKTKDAKEAELEYDKEIAEAKKKYDAEIYDAREERELQILELQMRGLESFRQAAGQIFDAITSKDPGQAIQNFFLGKVKDLGRGVFENLAQQAFTRAGGQSALSFPGQLQSDGKTLTPLGQLLKGTVLAGDTQTRIASVAGTADGRSIDLQARQQNTNAVVSQTKATIDLTNALTYVATGGASGSLPSGASVSGGSSVTGDLASIPGLSTFASDLNGITGSLGPGANPVAKIAGLLKLSSGSNPISFNIPSLADVLGPMGGPPDLGTVGSDTSGITGSGDLSSLPLPGSGMNPAVSAPQAQLSNLAQFKGAVGDFGAGAASVAKGQGVQDLFGYGAGDGDSTATKVGAGVGIAAATYEGVSSAIKDFNKGGARGVVAGVGNIASTALAVDPDPTGISQMALGAVALGAKIVSAILGDPKAARQAQIAHELTNSQYNSTGYIDARGNFVPGAQAKAISYFGASGGQSFDYNFMGGIREGSYASTSRNTYDPSAAANQLRNGYLPPPAGTRTDQALGFGDQPYSGSASTVSGPRGGAAQQPPIVVQVQTMDAKSFLDHAANISNAVRKGIQMGHPVVQEIKQAVVPR